MARARRKWEEERRREATAEAVAGRRRAAAEASPRPLWGAASKSEVVPLDLAHRFPPPTQGHTLSSVFPDTVRSFRDTPDSSLVVPRRTSSATCTGRRVCGFVTSYRNDLPHIYCASQQSAHSLTMLMQSTATRATPPCEPRRLRVHLVHHHKSPYANWQRAAPCVRTVCKRILCVGTTPTTCFCKQGCCVKPTVKPSLSKAALSGGRRVLRQWARPALRPAEVASEERCSLGHDIRKSLAAHAYWGEYVGKL